jgi:hypothetical protein
MAGCREGHLHTCGTKFTLCVNKFTLCVNKFTLCANKFTLCVNKFTLCANKFSLCVDKFSLCAGEFSPRENSPERGENLCAYGSRGHSVISKCGDEIFADCRETRYFLCVVHGWLLDNCFEYLLQIYCILS